MPRIIARILILWLTAGTPAVTAQVRIDFTPFAGIGLSYSGSVTSPDMDINDNYDQNYYRANYANPDVFFMRGQGRFNLLYAGDLSLGYLFWGHKAEYSSRLPDQEAKVGVVYPHSYYYSMHTVTLQYNLSWLLKNSDQVQPFLIAGAGSYYGRKSDMKFVWINQEERTVEQEVMRAEKVDGYGYTAGVGAVIFTYIYVYGGFVHLNGDNLPANGFAELIIGLTI